MATSRVYTPDEIKVKITTSPIWAEHAITKLFEQQTAQEQDMEVTAYKNGRGFNATDAEILSSFAKQIEKKASWTHPVPEGQRLSPKQLALAYKRLGKYAKQLHRLAYGDQKAEKAQAQGEPVSSAGTDIEIDLTRSTVPQPTDIEIESAEFNQRWVELKNEFATREREEEEAAEAQMWESDLAAERRNERILEDRGLY